MSESSERPVEIGPCGVCGGYGIVFDEEARREQGTCHRDIDAREIARMDLETARASELWSGAVEALRDKFARHDQLEEIRRLMEQEGGGRWPASHHLLGGGMQLRNFLRQEGFGEDTLEIVNLDNVYAAMVYEAVHGEPAPDSRVGPVEEEGEGEGLAASWRKIGQPIRTAIPGKCARCGGDHDEIEFQPLSRPTRWTHWAPCPENGEPIMLRLTASPPSPEGSVTDER